jgi:hypothetical protein
MRMMGMEMARVMRAPTPRLTPPSLGESRAEEAEAEPQEPQGVTRAYAHVCFCMLMYAAAAATDASIHDTCVCSRMLM